MSEWYLSNDIQAELSTEWFDKPEIVAELQLDPDMIRQDFTMKSNQGYLGQVKDNKGYTMTEQSIDVDIDGKKVLMPLLVPGLNNEEINAIKAGKDGDPILIKSAEDKAIEHGKQRIKEGKSPFFEDKPQSITLDSDEVPIGNVGKDVDPSIIKSVLEKEGGFQNNPDDSGNYNKAGELIGTNLGITPATYEAVFGKEPTVEELKNITPTQAAKIYKKEFYERYNIDKLPSNLQKIAMHALVTGGPKTIKYLQELAGTKQDMLIGEQTTQAIKDKRITAKQLKDKVLSEYKKLDGWKKFGKGWTNRMNETVSD